MMTSTPFRFFSAILLALWLPQAATAADVIVISHPGVIIPASEVKDIFLGEEQFSGKIKLIPVDNEALQEDFLSQWMKMDATKYHNIWTKKSFRDGLIPPAVKANDTAVLDYVKRTPGAIGYVSTAPAGINIVR
jgi:ABC-type phosphate transport system substrate-binding protein